MSTPVISKQCRKCGVTKELSEFHIKRSSPDGRQPKCKTCALALLKQWQTDNKERFYARIKKWKAENRDKVLDGHRRYHASQPPKTSEYHRSIALRRRGLTIAEYDAVLQSQGGLCAICGEPNTQKKEFAVDHDHRCCGLRAACHRCRRGLLCSPCNTALHALENDREWHNKAMAYLAKYPPPS